MNLGPLFNWAVSIIRTSVVPAIVGVLGAAAIYAGTDLPPDAAAVITAGLAVAYWAIVKTLEYRFPKAGWLLLIPRPPAYSAERLREFKRSAIRTFTPYLVGLAVGVLAKHGFNIDSKMTTSLVTVLVGGGYYSGVRALEGSKPAAGILIGATGAPSYTNDENIEGGGC